jgi:hypothetical protein
MRRSTTLAAVGSEVWCKVLLAAGRQQTIAFAPRADGKALVATGEFKAERSLRVVVQLVPSAGQPRVQARYAPVEAAG